MTTSPWPHAPAAAPLRISYHHSGDPLLRSSCHPLCYCRHSAFPVHSSRQTTFHCPPWEASLTWSNCPLFRVWKPYALSPSGSRISFSLPAFLKMCPAAPLTASPQHNQTCLCSAFLWLSSCRPCCSAAMGLLHQLLSWWPTLMRSCWCPLDHWNQTICAIFFLRLFHYFHLLGWMTF